MPKRSTTFQRVVYLLKTQMADGAKVTESRMLRDSNTNKDVEVDVVIEGRLGGEDMLISLECREHKRPCGPGWVDEMRGKHEHLPTNKLVLVSHSGFTKTARRRAETHGIVPAEPRDLEGGDPGRTLVGRIENLIFKSLNLNPLAVIASVEANDNEPAEDVALRADHNIYFESGELVGNLIDLVQLAQHRAPTPELVRDASPDTNSYAIDMNPVNIPGPDGVVHDLFLQKEDPIPHLRRIANLSLDTPMNDRRR